MIPWLACAISRTPSRSRALAGLLNCHTSVHDSVTNQIRAIPTCYQAWDPDTIFDGPTGSAMVLGYLSSIWETVRHGGGGITGPTQEVFSDGQGEMYSDNIAYSDGFYKAAIRIVSTPNDTDLLYGSPPIGYYGMCGWGARASQGAKATFVAGVFKVGVEVSETFREPPIFVNHEKSMFVTPMGAQRNVFWWHLKKGIDAYVTGFGRATGFGFTSEPGYKYHWNPNSGGWNGDDLFVDTTPGRYVNGCLVTDRIVEGTPSENPDQGGPVG